MRYLLFQNYGCLSKTKLNAVVNMADSTSLIAYTHNISYLHKKTNKQTEVGVASLKSCDSLQL